MRKLVITAVTLICMSLSGIAFAQTATPRVTERQINQQELIQEGKRSGELTRREKRHLQMQQAKIQHDKKEAKADGVVTPQERRQLNREQNRANRNIYRQKHDAQSR